MEEACRKVFSGEFVGNAALRFKWICEDCLAEGQDRTLSAPSADPARYAELRAKKVAKVPGPGQTFFFEAG